MITFTQLEIDPNDIDKLYYDVSIPTSSQTDYYITGVYLEYYKNRNVTNAPNPSTALVILDNTGTIAPVDKTKYRAYGTVYKSQLDYDTMGVATFEDGLFYLIVSWKNKDEELHPDDEAADVKSVLDWNAVYNRGMAFVDRALVGCKSGNCSINEDLEQAVMIWHAIEFAMAANDADELDMLWSRFITYSPLTGAQTGSTCNCI